jgi:hypothetical protein
MPPPLLLLAGAQPSSVVVIGLTKPNKKQNKTKKNEKKRKERGQPKPCAGWSSSPLCDFLSPRPRDSRLHALYMLAA